MSEVCDWAHCHGSVYLTWKPHPKYCQRVLLCEHHWDMLCDATSQTDNGHGSRLLRKAIKSLGTPTGWIRRLTKQGRLTRCRS